MIKSYAKLYKKFEKEQEKIREEYTALGMSEEQILEMYEFDKQQLARDIAFQRRTQELNTVDDEYDDERNVLLKKFGKELSVEIDLSCISRYSWIEEIENEWCAKKVKLLSLDDLELITLYVFEKYTQTEIAKIYGISQKNISKKIKRIKKILI